MSGLGELGLIAIVAGLVLWFGWKQGFFRWQPDAFWNRNILLYQVAGGFALYFLLSFLAPAFYTQIFQPTFTTQVSFISYATWLNFFLSSSIALALLVFWRAMPQETRMA